MRVLAGLLAFVLLAGCSDPGSSGATSRTTDGFAYDTGTGGPTGGNTGGQGNVPPTTTRATTTRTTAPTTTGPPVDPCRDVTRAGLELEDEAHSVVAISTSLGCLVAEIYDDKAPITAANFLRYVREGFYSGTSFYRIVPNFVNQAGGERMGREGEHPPIQNEAGVSGLSNRLHTLAMARTGDPHSATTEFYINQADNCFLDHPSVSTCPQDVVSADGYAVFGRLVAGTDVSDRINQSANVAIQQVRVLA